MDRFEIETTRREQFIDITAKVQAAVRNAGAREGAVIVYVPHTTAACTINENADPDVVHDMLEHLRITVPHFADHYRHGEGNSDSHIKAAFMGASQHVIIENGELQLGRWQGIFFCEFDGPRRRSVWVEVLRGSK